MKKLLIVAGVIATSIILYKRNKKVKEKVDTFTKATKQRLKNIVTGAESNVKEVVNEKEVK